MLCKVIQFLRGSYYAWKNRKESQAAKENRKVIHSVKLTQAKVKGSCGARRHAEKLSDQGFLVEEHEQKLL